MAPGNGQKGGPGACSQLGGVPSSVQDGQSPPSHRTTPTGGIHRLCLLPGRGKESQEVGTCAPSPAALHQAAPAFSSSGRIGTSRARPWHLGRALPSRPRSFYAPKRSLQTRNRRAASPPSSWGNYILSLLSGPPQSLSFPPKDTDAKSGGPGTRARAPGEGVHGVDRKRGLYLQESPWDRCHTRGRGSTWQTGTKEKDRWAVPEGKPGREETGGAANPGLRIPLEGFPPTHSSLTRKHNRTQFCLLGPSHPDPLGPQLLL